MSENRLEFLCETQWLHDHLDCADVRIIETTYFLDFTPAGEAKLTSGRAAWQTAHIPNSTYIDLLTELSDPATPLPFMMPPPGQFNREMSRLGIDATTRVVIYDRHEMTWATRLWWMLRASGFDRAAIVNGGWPKWQGEGRPVSNGPAPTIPSTVFIGSQRPQLFADKHTVLTSIGKNHTALICALDRQIHARGHIPGSLNVPLIDLLDPRTKTFLPVEQLDERFRQAGISRSQPIITYCGGGIASTCTAFVLTLLGYDNVAVYDGSLEEWKRDGALPLEAG